VANKECLQLRIGSCAGCKVQNILSEELRQNGVDRQQVVDVIERDLCPDEAVIQNAGNEEGLSWQYKVRGKLNAQRKLKT